MLINLSNHPFTEWSKKQLKMAIEKYEQIVDIPFPVVPPEGDSDKVSQLALDIVNSVCAKFTNEKFTVHIMGELTFIYTAVQEFHKRGIECIASTSKRVVSLSANGEKISKFDFVRFRAYRSLLNTHHP